LEICYLSNKVQAGVVVPLRTETSLEIEKIIQRARKRATTI
jgi:hypothetical protein